MARLTGIAGDGRADYLVKGEKGSLDLWLNIGEAGTAKLNLAPAGQIAGGLGSPNITLADITGDGRLSPHPPVLLSSTRYHANLNSQDERIISRLTKMEVFLVILMSVVKRKHSLFGYRIPTPSLLQEALPALSLLG